MPLFAVISVNPPLVLFKYTGNVSSFNATMEISGYPSLFKSRKSTPIPEIRLPCSGRATPASNATSSKTGTEEFLPLRL